MNNNSLETITGLQGRGFEGFCSFKDMYAAGGVVPAPSCKGVYLVLWYRKDRPKFLLTGTGGWLKRKGDPNVRIEALKANWVEDALIIYAGASKPGQNGTLKKRIELLLRFGDYGNVRHYGGRLMWQIKNSEDLKVCWKAITDDSQEEIRKQILKEFKQTHNDNLPFANQPNRTRTASN